MHRIDSCVHSITTHRAGHRCWCVCTAPPLLVLQLNTQYTQKHTHSTHIMRNTIIFSTHLAAHRCWCVGTAPLPLVLQPPCCPLASCLAACGWWLARLLGVLKAFVNGLHTSGAAQRRYRKPLCVTHHITQAPTNPFSLSLLIAPNHSLSVSEPPAC